MQLQVRKQQGFTLVEIAIVLVIVGLLIGGVLKGQEMITNARLKRIESDNAGYAAAMFSYQDRYQELPGDDDGVFNRFEVYSGHATLTSALVAGDGDGAIEGAWDASETDFSATTVEAQKFFGHLRAAGLTTGSGTNIDHPKHAYNGNIGIQDGSLGINGYAFIFASLEGGIASIIDGRLDDGAPNSGLIEAALDSGSMAAAGAAATAYAESSSYDVAIKQ